MRFQAVVALAALLVTSLERASATEASGRVLVFGSARAGLAIFEPRVTFAEMRKSIAAGDALEFEILTPVKGAERIGVEIVFAGGRRSVAPRPVESSAWQHVRIALDEFAGSETEHFELVARGYSSDQIGYRVDSVVITHASGEPTIVFDETLPGGARIVRDDRRQAGAALVDVGAGFDGGSTEIAAADVADPWHAYDLSILRRSAASPAASERPFGGVLVGPCVPMRFARRMEHESLPAEGQKFLFEPLEGGRFYTVWLALSTTDGEALSTRYVAFGEAGERRSVGIVVPKRGDAESRSTDLGSCRLVSSTIASLVPLLGIELPNEPRLRVHAITFQWHRDGASDARFHSAWLRDQASTPSGLSRERSDALLRWAENREVGPSFVEGVVDLAAERSLFAALVRGDLTEFDGLLSRESDRQLALGSRLKRLHVALEEVRDDRGVVRIEQGIDGESMLHAFATQSEAGAFVLEGDPAILRQAPQVMAGMGRTAALLAGGPRIARWSAPDDSSVLVIAPFRVLLDAREFADAPWRQWDLAVSSKVAPPELLLAVDGSQRARTDAVGIVKRLSALSCVPRLSSATAEVFVAEAGLRLGTECPTFVPGEMIPVADDDRRHVVLRAPALRRAQNAVSALSMLSTPARMDGSEYPGAIIDELRASVRSLSNADPRAEAARIVARAEAELASELGILARGASTLGKGTPIVAFNTLPWSRRALVQLDSKSGALFGSDGGPLPWQTTARGSRLFALEVPALGYHVVRGLRGDDNAAIDERDKVRVDGWTARNDRMAFTLDPKSGAIESLRLVAKDQELLAGPARLAGDGWTVESAEFTEKGPLRAVARVVSSHAGRRVELEFVLEMRSAVLEVKARAVGEDISWRVQGRHVTPRALFGVPFGSTVAGPHADGSPARHRIADWAASTDGNDGIGILAGDLATVLVEADAITPEFASSVETRFALVPFSGGWRKACLAERATEFGTPLAMIATDAHDGARSTLHSFLKMTRVEGLSRRIEGAECGVVMSALEPTADGSAYIVRLAETHGAMAAVALEFDRPVFGAESVNLRGDVRFPLRVDERNVEIVMGPYRIETVRVRMRP